MKFTCKIINILPKTQKDYLIRATKNDKIYSFHCFNQHLIADLKTKINVECDLDLFPLQETTYMGKQYPSSIVVMGFYKPWESKTESKSKPAEKVNELPQDLSNKDGDLPF